MKQRNKVPNLDHIGRKPGEPRKPAGRILEEPPPEAFMTPGETHDRDDDGEDEVPKRERRSRERPSN